MLSQENSWSQEDYYQTFCALWGNFEIPSFVLHRFSYFSYFLSFWATKSASKDSDKSSAKKGKEIFMVVENKLKIFEYFSKTIK